MIAVAYRIDRTEPFVEKIVLRNARFIAFFADNRAERFIGMNVYDRIAARDRRSASRNTADLLQA